MWRRTNRLMIATLMLAVSAAIAAPAVRAQAQDADKQNKDAAQRAAEEARQIEQAAQRELEARQRALDAQQKKATEVRAAQERQNVDLNLRMQEKRLAELQARDAAAAAEKAVLQDWAIDAKIRDQFVQEVQTRRVKVAHCGVGTSDLPAVLSEHLQLPLKMGLVVDYVEPQSPAEQSGLKQYDILVKFDDQRLAHSDQLRALVRLRKPGDDVKMSIIRQGQPKELIVELGEREIDEAIEVGAAPAVGGARNVFVFPNGQGRGPVVIAPPGGEAIAITNVNGVEQAVWADGTHKIAIDLKDGKALKVAIRAQDGAVDGAPLFEGPLETPDQRKAIPAEFADKVKRAEAALPKAAPPGAQVAPAPQRAGMAINRGRLWIADGNITLNADGGAFVLDPATGAAIGGGGRTGAGGRVVTSTDKDNLMVARIDGGKVSYALVFSQADGKTLFEGPVKTEEQRKALPEVVAKQLEVLEKNQNIAPEFGVLGRN